MYRALANKTMLYDFFQIYFFGFSILLSVIFPMIPYLQISGKPLEHLQETA